MKNSIKLITALCMLVAGFSSCEKSLSNSEPIASLNVVAGVIGGGNVKLNNNIGDSIILYNAKILSIVPGKAIRLYPTNNTSLSYFNESSVIENGGIYSVFLAGQGSTFDPILIKENLPERYRDSIFGVRIVNLSPNSTPLNVTLASAETTNVFTNVAYKQITSITTFPLRTVIPNGSISFQFRNTDGSLLASYTLPTFVNSLYPGISTTLQRFKNISLVVKGLMGTTTGPDAFGVFPVVTTY